MTNPNSKLRRVRNQGFSKIVTIPSGMCKHFGIEEGTEMMVEQTDRGILIYPTEVKK